MDTLKTNNPLQARGHHSHHHHKERASGSRSRDRHERRKSHDSDRRKSVDDDSLNDLKQVKQLAEAPVPPTSLGETSPAPYLRVSAQPYPPTAQLNMNSPQPPQYVTQPVQLQGPQPVQMILPGPQQILVTTPEAHPTAPVSGEQQFKLVGQPIQYISVQPVLVPNHRNQRTNEADKDRRNSQAKDSNNKQPMSKEPRKPNEGSEGWKSQGFDQRSTNGHRQSWNSDGREYSNDQYQNRRPSMTPGSNDYKSNSQGYGANQKRNSFEYSSNQGNDRRNPNQMRGAPFDDNKWRGPTQGRFNPNQDEPFGHDPNYGARNRTNQPQWRNASQNDGLWPQDDGPYQSQSMGNPQGQTNRHGFPYNPGNGQIPWNQNSSNAYNENKNWGNNGGGRSYPSNNGTHGSAPTGAGWNNADWGPNQSNNEPHYNSQGPPPFNNAPRYDRPSPQGPYRQRSDSQNGRPSMGQQRGFSQSGMPTNQNQGMRGGYPQPFPSPNQIGIRPTDDYQQNPNDFQGYPPNHGFRNNPNQAYGPPGHNSNMQEAFSPSQNYAPPYNPRYSQGYYPNQGPGGSPRYDPNLDYNGTWYNPPQRPPPNQNYNTNQPGACTPYPSNQQMPSQYQVPSRGPPPQDYSNKPQEGRMSLTHAPANPATSQTAKQIQNTPAKQPDCQSVNTKQGISPSGKSVESKDNKILQNSQTRTPSNGQQTIHQ